MTVPKTKRSAIGRRAVLGVAGGLMLPAPAIHAQGTSSGVALVIGNSKYQWEGPLPNVRRDAPDIARRFQAMGLKTELLQDVGRDALRQAIDRFASSVRGANLAAFYFAGHGAYWAKNTHLVPVDVDLSDPGVVQTLVSVTSITAAGAEASHRLTIIDACRNNPADGWRQLEAQQDSATNSTWDRELAARSPNALLLYSTSPGRVAVDGPAGQNSPFAAALMRQLDAPSVDLSTLAPKLRRDLLIATEGRQVVWERNSFKDAFVLKGARLPEVANKSGWASDPSRIMELPKAYALARDNKFILPGGLIAHRPAGASPGSQLVGSFQYEINIPMRGRMLQAMIVMSVDDGRTAEIILFGTTVGGSFWRFVTGTVSENRLEFVPRARDAKHMFRWRDANSGSLSLMFQGAVQGGMASSNTSFTRLDG